MNPILAPESATRPRATKATTVSGPARSRADDIFFAAMSLVILGTVFLGFAPHYYLAGGFHAPLPSVIVHIHAAVFSAWIMLFTAQTTLISSGRVNWHKRVGIFGAVLACLMVVLGVLVTIDSVRRRFTPPGLDSPRFLALDLLEISVFAFLVASGLRVRRDGAAHKRLILLSTVALLGAAISRWAMTFPILLKFPAITGLVVDGLLLSIMIFDLLTRRRIHRVTLWGSLLIFLIIPVAFGLLGSSLFWQRFTEWVQR
jgi:hypothetical protein